MSVDGPLRKFADAATTSALSGKRTSRMRAVFLGTSVSMAIGAIGNLVIERKK
jgi:hypothetical protein